MHEDESECGSIDDEGDSTESGERSSEGGRQANCANTPMVVLTSDLRQPQEDGSLKDCGVEETSGNELKAAAVGWKRGV
jgi:hypothetical protein